MYKHASKNKAAQILSNFLKGRRIEIPLFHSISAENIKPFLRSGAKLKAPLMHRGPSLERGMGVARFSVPTVEKEYFRKLLEIKPGILDPIKAGKFRVKRYDRPLFFYSKRMRNLSKTLQEGLEQAYGAGGLSKALEQQGKYPGRGLGDLFIEVLGRRLGRIKEPYFISYTTGRPLRTYGPVHMLIDPSKIKGDISAITRNISLGGKTEGFIRPIIKKIKVAPGKHRFGMELPTAGGQLFYEPRRLYRELGPEAIKLNRKLKELGAIPYTSRTTKILESLKKGV